LIFSSPRKKLNEKRNKNVAIGRGRFGSLRFGSLLASSSHRSTTEVNIPPHSQGETSMFAMMVYIVW
jgi:hypothetical protein